MGMKLNEYGLFEEGGKAIPCADEKELFAALGLGYIPPELREGLEEVQAAEAGELPRLVATEDILGGVQAPMQSPPAISQPLSPPPPPPGQSGGGNQTKRLIVMLGIVLALMLVVVVVFALL